MENPNLNSSLRQMPGLDLPADKPRSKEERKNLAIALAVSTAFLLVATGIATWLFISKSGQSVVTQVDPNSTANVKTVQWVEPELPEGFSKYGQSTVESDAMYFADTSEGCAVTAKVFALISEGNLQAEALAAQDSEGVTSASGDEGDQLAISDSDGERQYDFESFEFSQTLSSPTVDHDLRVGKLYYRQFGNYLATIAHTCKEVTAGVNAKDLDNFVSRFTVRTVR